MRRAQLTLVNVVCSLVAWDQALLLIDPVFCRFPHCGALSQASSLTVLNFLYLPNFCILLKTLPPQRKGKWQDPNFWLIRCFSLFWKVSVHMCILDSSITICLISSFDALVFYSENVSASSPLFDLQRLTNSFNLANLKAESTSVLFVAK